MPRRSRPILLRRKERKGSNGDRLSTPRGGELLPPGASRRGVLWLALIGLPGWAIVVVVFWKALAQPDQLIFSLVVWLAILIVVGLATLAWSRYTELVRVRARKVRQSGRDETTPLWELLLTKDALGREIRMEPEAPTAQVVTVMIDGEVKTFRGGE